MSGVRSLRRGATLVGYATGASAPIYVDSDDNLVKLIPAGSGTTQKTLVDTDSTQTLTNKTIGSPAAVTDAFTITGSADPLKLIRFEVDGVTTGNTRVITPPDEDFTIAGVATVQTLTNKTLTNPVVNAAAGTVVVPTSASPAQTTEGSVVWDSDDDLLTVGDGASRKIMADTAGTQTLTNKTLTSPVITTPASTSTGFVFSKTITYTEDATSLTHTGTVTLPAGATLQNIQVTSSVLWTDASSVISVGDAQSATGWFNAINVAATDLLVGEVLDISNAENWGGKQGAYLVAASGVKGQATASRSGVYYGSGGVVIGVITVTTPSGTAGRTFMTVTYSVGAVTAATIA